MQTSALDAYVPREQRVASAGKEERLRGRGEKEALLRSKEPHSLALATTARAAAATAAKAAAGFFEEYSSATSMFAVEIWRGKEV